MAYQAEISRNNPTCFLFLIDQSSSMVDPIMGVPGNLLKAQFISDVLNKLVITLAATATPEGELRRYFQIGAIGYGARVGAAFGGVHENQDLVWIDDLYNNPIRMEDRMKTQSDGVGGIIQIPKKFPIWFEAIASGSTPMAQAFEQAFGILQNWVQHHALAYPPTVINLTDGEPDPATDPAPVADRIRSLATNDGNVVLLTLHASSKPHAKEHFFPSTSEELPDENSRKMFAMSSLLTPKMLKKSAELLSTTLQPDARGIVYNAGIQGIVQALEIGTLPANQR